MSRVGFSSRIGFVAAAAGSAVGLGNIWRFPYETGQHGGAAFLFVYLICIVIIGYPVMVGEIALGRSAQANPFRAYTKLGSKTWGILGLWGILCGIMFLSAYNVVAGWAFGYFINISFGNLLATDDLSGHFGGYIADISDNFFYSLGFMFLTGLIVAGGIKKGIETASKILMPLLFILLIGLITYSLTLDNAWAGVRFYLVPDFSSINIRTIYSALGQAFFSLSLGMGALITYGSYISKKDNIANSASLVVFTDTLVAFLAGMLIFPLVFSQGATPTQGPGLVFVVLPGIFQEMGPVAGRIVGGSFFLLLCFAALTSTISLLEIPATYLVDEKKWSRVRVVILSATLIFLVSLPSMLSHGAMDYFTHFLHYESQDKSFFDFVFDLFSDVGLPLGGFLMMIFIARKWGMDKFSQELSEGNPNYQTSILKGFLSLMVRWVNPVILGIMFIITVLQKFFDIRIF